MMQLENIYQFFMSKITALALSDEITDEAEIKTLLHSIANDAELMHCYVGFRDENEQRKAQGLPSLSVEDEFSGIDAATIHFFLQHENLF